MIVAVFWNGKCIGRVLVVGCKINGRKGGKNEKKNKKN